MSVVLERPTTSTNNTNVVFSANFADESVVLSLQDHALGHQPALTAAIALAELQAEICYLEELLQTKLNFNWSNKKPSNDGSSQHRLSIHGFSLAGSRLNIEVPASAISSCNRTTEIKTPDSLQWEPLRAQLKLSAPVLSASDINNIEEGAMLLMPESFTSQWNVQLEIGKTAQKVTGNLDPDKLLFTINADSRTNNTAEAQIHTQESESTFEIYTSEPLAVSPEALFGLPALDLPTNLANQKLQLISTQGAYCHGTLAKIGNGYGFYITQRVKNA